MNGNTMHEHPLDQGQAVFGRRLEYGEEIQATDVYNSTSEKWLPVPPALVGVKYGEYPTFICIRPADDD